MMDDITAKLVASISFGVMSTASFRRGIYQTIKRISQINQLIAR
jgi:hypothetical protein